MSKPEILLLGGGGHCHACVDVIQAEGRFAIAGIVERDGADFSATVMGYPVLGTDAQLPELRKRYAHALVTLGQIRNPAPRIHLFEQLQDLGFSLPVICSPRAYCAPSARVGNGTILMHEALVNANAWVGENCILNSKALVEHDVVVGAHCHISTAAVLNGGVTVGERSFVGSNAVCVQGIALPEGTFVKAMSLMNVL